MGAMSLTTQLAKLSPPRLDRVFLRERLFAIFDQNLDKPLIWVASPAGAGKTLAVAKYTQSRQRPTIWFQADEGDGDIASFFYYLGIAASQFPAKDKKHLPVLSPEYQADGLNVFARNFFRELFQRMPKNGILVIDNYHVIPIEQIHLVIQIAAEETPHGRHLLVISRNEPPLQLAKFQASGRMALLGWDTIQLAEEETIGISEIQGKHTLSATTLKLLHRETQGWVAGLVLLLAHTEQSLARWQETKSNEKIFEYFA